MRLDPGWGHLVIIAHQRDWVNIYAHHQERLVSEGDQVKQGAVIAKVGSTGRVQSHSYTLAASGRHASKPAIWLPARQVYRVHESASGLC